MGAQIRNVAQPQALRQGLGNPECVAILEAERCAHREAALPQRLCHGRGTHRMRQIGQQLLREGAGVLGINIDAAGAQGLPQDGTAAHGAPMLEREALPRCLELQQLAQNNRLREVLRPDHRDARRCGGARITQPSAAGEQAQREAETGSHVQRAGGNGARASGGGR